jgi:predicted RND superfamily exporter protein
MIKFFESIIKHKKIVIILFLIIAAASGFLMLGVGRNYDMSKYLPAGSESKTGVDILKSEYGYNGFAVLMVENKSIPEVLDIKRQLKDINGIKQVIWLDDAADIKQPVEMVESSVKEDYLNGSFALLHIVFEENDYSDLTRSAIDGIRDLLGPDAAVSGSAVDAYATVDSINGSIMTGILIALAIVLVILLLTTNSFIEVLIFFISIGAAILINMGTNFIFGEISFMTFACGAILQLAVSMDYSIFLLHRFEHERTMERDPAKAMAKAAKASFSSILSSGTTTIVGFAALIFMSYTIGADMGLVLAKGIVFSLITMLIFLPAITAGCVKAIDKTKHKRLLPNMRKVQHLLDGKAKYVVFALLIIVSVIGFMAQNKNTYLYSTSSINNGNQKTVDEKINEEFGEINQFVLIVPKGNAAQEYGMVQEIKAMPDIKGVQGLYSFIDPAVPEEMVPDDVKDEFLSGNYSRYVIDVNADIEGEKAFAAVEGIRETSSKWFDESYLTGASPVIFDIRNATAGDFSLVTLLSILFVGIILLITFRSITIPVVLVYIIETSIWINMSFPYFTGDPMIFLGYMVISSVQLGATIDYAILMTNYYLEGRKALPKKEASEYAAEKAGMSIVMSALVLSSAGFVVAAAFKQQALSQLGILIGRGALLSGFLAVFVLPQVLILLDKIILKTSFIKGLRRKQNEG